MVEGVSPAESMQSKYLDDLSIYPKLDPSELRHRLRGFPSQCREAWDKAHAFDLPKTYEKVTKVVIAGMGGSAIGGDLLADLASTDTSVPVIVSRDYRLPSYTDENTLVLVCSYSGNTQETLSSFQHALSLGAKIVAITGGGELASTAKAHGVPTFSIDYLGEPRSALGYSALVPTVMLMNLGLMVDKTLEYEEAIHILDALVVEFAEDSQTPKNTAKDLATQLLNRLIVVYGAGIFSGVARRWKTQFNENSKVWAFFELLPEAHHNSVVGYPLPTEVTGRSYVVFLRPRFLHPQTHKRYQVTQDLLERESVPTRIVEGRGDSALAQILSTVVLGDYTSYYLALLQQVDPSPTTSIDFVKDRLSS